MKDKILLVDDEVNILKSIKRELSAELYGIFTAESGEEGLEILQKQTMKVIISDLRMPEMDGISFFEQAHKLQPDAIKIILSGHADISDVLQAINKGEVFRYIVKPWDKNELNAVIKQAISLYNLKKDKEELLIKLNKQSEELFQLNSDLDKMVKERTYELEVKDKIVHHMLQLNPFNESVSFLLTNFLKILKQNKIIFLQFNSNDNMEVVSAYQNFGKKEAKDIMNEVKNIFNTGVFKRFYTHKVLTRHNAPKEVIKELEKLNVAYFIINAIHNTHDDFGILINSFSYKPENLAGVIEKIESCTLYLTMLMSDHSVIGNMDSLYKNIGLILKEIQ